MLFKPPVILFIPVSSPSGIGEYARSLIIADKIKQTYSNADIHFILNKFVSYFSDCPYPAHPCSGSATKDVKSVNTAISQLKPDLVIFDASGRAKQIKHAKSTGAKVAFISQHKKKRNRGLKLNRLFNIDIHWVAQPSFCIPPLSFWQRSKLALFNKKAPQPIGPVYADILEEEVTKELEKQGLNNEEYFIFNAGSGGHKCGEIYSIDILYEAACLFAEKTGTKCVVVFGANYPKALFKQKFNQDIDDLVVCLPSLSHRSFLCLLMAAKGRVISAGDTLLQCIDMEKPCIAVAVSKDQPNRLAQCQQLNLVLAADLTVNSLYQQAFIITGIKYHSAYV